MRYKDIPKGAKLVDINGVDRKWLVGFYISLNSSYYYKSAREKWGDFPDISNPEIRNKPEVKKKWSWFRAIMIPNGKTYKVFAYTYDSKMVPDIFGKYIFEIDKEEREKLLRSYGTPTLITLTKEEYESLEMQRKEEDK